jgi:chromosome segregation ATPase
LLHCGLQTGIQSTAMTRKAHLGNRISPVGTAGASIIVPAYNAARTVRDTLDSILAQTYSNWETIVVDDGSTDSTAKIVQKFVQRDGRIQLIRQSNCGESGARNTGIAAARSVWLAFVDADDWIAPTYLERLIAELNANPEFDAVHCGSVRVAADGTYVDDDYRPPAGDLFPTLARRAAFPVNACMVRKSLVGEVGGFDASLKTCADWDMWQKVARMGARFGAVRDVLAFYRMAPNSASLDAEQLLADGLTVLRRGHTADPRVPSPNPEHALGLRGRTVESQEFYLLSWNAGLLIGSRKDATHLLASVQGDHYPCLYADAIARCVFEAAALPNCRGWEVWENLWPKVNALANTFFQALENQSQTPDLAESSQLELKKLVLVHSRTWGAVMAREHQTIRGQKSALDELRQAHTLLEKDRDAWREQAQEYKAANSVLESALETSRHTIEAARDEAALLRRHRAELEQTKATLESELETSRHTIETTRDEAALLRRRGAELAQEKAALESELETSRHTIEVACDEAALLRRWGAELEQRKATLESELEISRHTIETARGEAALLRQHGAELEQTKATLESELETSRRTIETVRGEATLLRQHGAELEQTKATLESELETSRRTIETVRGEATLLRQHGAELEQKKSALEFELGTSRHAIEAARDEAALLRQHGAELEQEKAGLESELETSRHTFQTTRDEAALLRQRGAELEQEKAGLESELEKSRARIEAASAEMASLDKELGVWEQSTADLVFELSRLRQQTWVRAGLRLGIVREPDGFPDSQNREASSGPPDDRERPGTESDCSPKTVQDGRWQLRSAPGNTVRLVRVPGVDETIRIAILSFTTGKRWDIQVNQPGFRVKAQQRYALNFRARADRPRTVGVGVAKADSPWSALGLYSKLVLSPDWRSFREEFVASADDDNARIHFDVGGRDIAVELSSLTLSSTTDGQLIEPVAPAHAMRV